MALRLRRSTRKTKRSSGSAAAYASSVFINCPFDTKYQRLFDAIVFAIIDSGFTARCALEIDNGAQIRIDKITRIIGDCCLAVHDLSRTQLDPKTRLPRFNMPLELGIFLGAHRFGSGRDRRKTCLILDTERYRYQKFISDIAGQDIKGHDNDCPKAITAVRNWLFSQTDRVSIPSGQKIHARFQQFEKGLPAACRKLHWQHRALTFREKVHLMSEWTRQVPLKK